MLGEKTRDHIGDIHDLLGARCAMQVQDANVVVMDIAQRAGVVKKGGRIADHGGGVWLCSGKGLFDVEQAPDGFAIAGFIPVSIVAFFGVQVVLSVGQLMDVSTRRKRGGREYLDGFPGNGLTTQRMIEGPIHTTKIDKIATVQSGGDVVEDIVGNGVKAPGVGHGLQ